MQAQMRTWDTGEDVDTGKDMGCRWGSGVQVRVWGVSGEVGYRWCGIQVGTWGTGGDVGYRW